MIDHFSISVSGFDAARAFYDAALAPLGIRYLVTIPPENTGGVRIGGYGRTEAQF